MKQKFIFVVITVFLSIVFSSIASSNIIVNENDNLKETQSISIDAIHQYSISDEKNVKIVFPLSTVPVIIERNNNFNVRYKATDFENVYIYISTAYEPIVDTIPLKIENTWKTQDIYNSEVKIPSDVPEELYNLTIVTLIDNKFYYNEQPRAVNVKEEITDDFNFIHVTDLHIGDIRGFKESIKETIGSKSIKRCINEINILQPDFVIISGDVVFGQYYPFEYQIEYKQCYEMIQMFDVPTYLAPGNHDGYKKITCDGFEFWEKYFGPLYYSFDYGNYHFQAINSYELPAIFRFTLMFLPIAWGGGIQEEQLQWIESDLENSKDANLTFQFLHHNPLWDTKKDSLIGLEYKNRESLLQLINQYEVDMVLAGHIHVDTVNMLDDTIYLTTTTPESSIDSEDGYWGYRLIEIKNGEIFSYNYKEPKYSIPSYHLNLKYINDHTAIVENELEQNINVLVKFNVPKRDYQIENGTLNMFREDTLFGQYYVTSTVPANTNKKIELKYDKEEDFQ